MPNNVKKNFQDIAFFNIEKSAPAAEKKCNIALVVGVTIIVTVSLIVIGYCLGVRVGWFEPACCSPLDVPLDFDFDFGA